MNRKRSDPHPPNPPPDPPFTYRPPAGSYLIEPIPIERELIYWKARAQALEAIAATAIQQYQTLIEELENTPR